MAHNRAEIIRRLSLGEALSYLGIVVSRKTGIARPDRPSLHVSSAQAYKLIKEFGLIAIQTGTGKAFVPKETKP